MNSRFGRTTTQRRFVDHSSEHDRCAEELVRWLLTIHLHEVPHGARDFCIDLLVYAVWPVLARTAISDRP